VPCLTDTAPEAAPGLPFVEVRYAVARPDAAAVIATKFGGGSMLNLLSGKCTDLLGIGTLLRAAEKCSDCQNVLSRTTMQ
jgi:hypothetical protein